MKLAWMMSLGLFWKVVLLILGVPLLLGLTAFAGYLLMFVLGALYYGLVLLWAFVTLVLFK